MKLIKSFIPAVNVTSNCNPSISYGRYRGLFFVAYTYWGKVFIADKDLNKIQIFDDFDDENPLNGISSSLMHGKIIVWVNKQYIIYLPTQINDLIENNGHLYKWNKIYSFQSTEIIHRASWSHQGERFIVSSGNSLSIYSPTDLSCTSYIVIWTHVNSSFCDMIEFSSDDLYFATSNYNETFVKVWYSSEKVTESINNLKYLSKFSIEAIRSASSQQYSFVYLAHPKPVTKICWRQKTSRFGGNYISNFLLTSCQDGIGRIWVDNFLNSRNIPAKETFIQETLSFIPDLNPFLGGTSPFISFCTIIIINSSMALHGCENVSKLPEFYWFDNKEIEIDSYASALFIEDSSCEEDSSPEYQKLFTSDELSQHKRAINQWYKSPDIVYSISKVDGSFLTWTIDHLDSINSIEFRTPGCLFSCSLTGAVPCKIAKSILSCAILHQSEVISNLSVRARNFRTDSSMTITSRSSLKEHNSPFGKPNSHYYPDLILDQVSTLYTVHLDGSLNTWKIDYSDRRSFSFVNNFYQTSTFKGLHYKVTYVTAHPYTPLVAIITQNQSEEITGFKTFLFIYRFAPILVNFSSNDTWTLQASIKFSQDDACSKLLWITSPSDYLNQKVYFSIVFLKGISLFNVHDNLNDDYLKIDSLNIFDGLLRTTGVDYVGTLMNSISLNILFFDMCHLYPSAQDIDFYHTFFICISGNNDEHFIHVWELSNGECKNTRGMDFPIFDEGKPEVLQSDTFRRNPYQDNYYVGKLVVDLAGDTPKEWSRTSHSSFVDPFERTHSVSFFAITHSNKVQFFELCVDKSSIQKDFFTLDSINFGSKLHTSRFSTLRLYCEPRIFTGLKECLHFYTSQERMLTISLSNMLEAAYFGIPTLDDSLFNNTIDALSRVFILRIFSNRLAGEWSWKQESCLRIPLSDFEASKHTVSQLIDCSEKMTLSWFSLDNGYHLLSIAILGKILTFSPCPQKSLDEQNIERGVTEEVYGSSIWSLMSMVSYDYYSTECYHSCWSMSGLFILGFDRLVFVYHPNETPNILSQPNNLNQPSLVSDEICEALSSTASKSFYSSTNFLSFLILDKFNLINDLLVDIQTQVKCSSNNLKLSTGSNFESISLCSEFDSLTPGNKTLAKLKPLFLWELFLQYLKVPTKQKASFDWSCTDSHISSSATTLADEDVVNINGKIFDSILCNNLLSFLKTGVISNMYEPELVVFKSLAVLCCEINKLLRTNHNLDSLGLQFIYHAKFQHIFRKESSLLLCQPILSGYHFLCAFHSNSKLELLRLLSEMLSNNFKWDLASSYGVGWWIIDEELRVNLLEMIAKSQYQESKDPLDAATFYLLLNKKSLILTLYKSKKDLKMVNFFSQDFSRDDVRIMAQKNAYHLLSIHRYSHAIAFFLLAALHWDAIQVCVSNLKDYQLAFIIASVYNCSESSYLKRFIDTYIISQDSNEIMFQDPFIRSLCSWKIHNTLQSIVTLVDKPAELRKRILSVDKSTGINFDVLHRLHQYVMFTHLKHHVKIKKYFLYLSQSLKDPYHYRGQVVTIDYLEKSYNRLQLSCIKFVQNQGFIQLSLMLCTQITSGTAPNQFSAKKYFPTNLISDKDMDTDIATDFEFPDVSTANNSVIIKRYLLFSSMVRCIIDDIKQLDGSSLLPTLWKNFKLFEFFTQKLYIENSTHALFSEISSLFDHNFNYSRDWMFIRKHSFLLVFAARYFSLQGINYVDKLIFINNIIQDLYNLIEKQRSLDNFLKILPPYFMSFHFQIHLFNPGVYLALVSNNLLTEFINLQIPKIIQSFQSSDDVLLQTKFCKMLNIIDILSSGLYSALGGDRASYVLNIALCEDVSLHYVDKNRIKHFLIQDELKDFSNLVETNFLVSIMVENYGASLSSILHFLEMYLTVQAVSLVYSIFKRNPVHIQRVLETMENFKSTLHKYIGGMSKITVDPSSYGPARISPTRFDTKDQLSIPLFIDLTNNSQALDQSKEFSFYSSPIRMLNDSLSEKIVCDFEDDSSNIDIVREEDLNTESYAWSIMSAAIFYYFIFYSRKCLQLFGLSPSKIYNYSVNIHSLINYINKLRVSTLMKLDTSSILPDNFLPFDTNPDYTNDQLSINSRVALKNFRELENTPFQSSYQKSHADLWNFLTKNQNVAHEMLLFSCSLTEKTWDIPDKTLYSVIYNESDITYNFCFNNSDLTCLSLATSTELMELKIQYGSVKNVTDLDPHMPHRNMNVLGEFLRDLKFISNPHSGSSTHKHIDNHSLRYTRSLPVTIKKETKYFSSNTILVESHPSEPYFISANNENKVFLYQFGVTDHLHHFYIPSINNSKIAHMCFNDFGNKFGIIDETGYLSLCLFNTSTNLKPYFQHECHNRHGSCFCFMGSSSLIATCGHSSDGCDVALWDTLMPPRSRLTCTFMSHEQGCTKVSYYPSHHSLLICGKKGALSLAIMYDLRTQKIIQSFYQAHSSTITSVCIDQNICVTGSADGIVKLWNLKLTHKDSFQLVRSFDPLSSLPSKPKDLTVNCIRVKIPYLFYTSQESFLIRYLDTSE